MQGEKDGSPWSHLEKSDHINVLELKAAKFAILTFTRWFQSTQCSYTNVVALTYLLKMGGTKNEEMTVLSKEIWEYLLAHKITITAEYLPGKLNVLSDKESRSVKDSSEWKLDPIVFNKICKLRGVPDIDLFASRLSHQVPAYMS